METKRIVGLVLLLSAALFAGDPKDWQRHPLVTAPLMGTPPEIDGNVNREEWQAAAQTGPLLLMADGVSDGMHRELYIGYDAGNLYIGFRLNRPANVTKPMMPG
ncbi:MAG: hypothetical protein QF886_05730, partial [Planctomycetota bacterium]|nr:hypothetical protein [Planctomycetota bacterium]